MRTSLMARLFFQASSLNPTINVRSLTKLQRASQTTVATMVDYLLTSLTSPIQQYRLNSLRVVSNENVKRTQRK